MNNTYIIYANRSTSQFNQKRQIMRVKIIEAHRGYIIVESLKRYNKKYPNANKTNGVPVRRINKEQVQLIIEERTNKWLAWETIRRREGTNKPGRARGGR